MASLYRRNNSNIWWCRFQLNGTRVQRSSGTSKKAQALRFLAKTMEEERQRQEQGFKKVRLEVLCEEYCSQHLPLLKPRTRGNYLGHIAVLKAHFGEDRYIDEVRKAHVAGLIADLKKSGLRTPTIRRYLATLSSMFSFAGGAYLKHDQGPASSHARSIDVCWPVPSHTSSLSSRWPWRLECAWKNFSG